MKKIFALIPMVSLILGLVPVFSISIHADNEQFEWVVPCEWAYIGDFSEGLALIRGYNEYGGAGFFGFVDRFGKIQIPMQWESAKPFSEGLAPVKHNGKWGYINQNGEIVIEPQFSQAYLFCEGMAHVINEDQKYGFIDQTGTVVIDFLYEGAKGFHEGLAVVRKDNRYGYITPDAQIAIDFQFGDANSFSEGYAIVENAYGYKTFIIDLNGNNVSEDMGDTFIKTNKHFIYDTKNQMLWVLYEGYKYISEYGGNYTYNSDTLVKSVKLTSKNPILDELYNNYRNYWINYSKECEVFSVKERKTEPEAEKWYLFDNEFKPIISTDNIMWGFYGYGGGTDGIVSFKRYDKKEEMGYMDLYGNTVIEPFIWQAYAFYEERAVVYDRNSKYGIIRLNNDGEIYKLPADPIGTAYPTTININGVSQNVYSINDHAYIDVNVLPKYGLNIKINENNRNIFLTRNFTHKTINMSDDCQPKDNYEVYNSDKTCYVRNNVASIYQIDGKVVIRVDDLRTFGTVVLNDNTKQADVFINSPYLPNEGILWQTITDPNGTYDVRYQAGYYILKTPFPDYKTKIYNSNFEFLFEDDSSAVPTVYNGVFKFRTGPDEFVYKNEFGEIVFEPEGYPENLYYDENEPIIPDPYPLLKIEGRIPGYSGSYTAWGTSKYYDENDNVILDDGLDNAGPFINGTALVSKGGTRIREGMAGSKWGLIDTSGNYIVEPIWESAQRFADGKIMVSEYIGGNRSSGLLDGRGNELLPMGYKDLVYKSNSDYAVVNAYSNGETYLINLKNQIIIPPYFYRIKELHNGIFSVGSGNGVSIVRVIDVPLLNGNVFVNNTKVDFDTPPLLINNRTMIPIRAVFEKLGCTVEWLGDSETAVITLGELRVEIKQDTNYIIKNGEYIYSDTAAINYNNRIYVPLRVISESLGCDVNYNDATGNVMIDY